MFKKLSHETSKQIIILNYCKGDFEKCARRTLKINGEEVPDDLFPNGEYLKA